MAIDLSSLRKVRADKPPIILIYGPEKMGKTTLASEFPAPVFLQTEDGASGTLELDSFGLLGSFPQVLDALAALATDDHQFRTVVVDSISKLERLVWAETCSRNNWTSIEQPGFGKGYVETDYVWGEFVEACKFLRDQQGLTIVLIGHAVTERFDDPETQSYTRYQIDLHKRAMAILTREVDGIFLVKKDVTIKTEGQQGKGRARADGGDTRWIYTEGRPAFQAGNRFNMPERVMYPKGEGFAALAPYLPIHQVAPAATTKKVA